MYYINTTKSFWLSSKSIQRICHWIKKLVLLFEKLIINSISATYVTSVLTKPTVTVTIGSSVVIVCNIILNAAIGPDLSVLNYTWCYNNIDITNRSEILEQDEETDAVTTRLNITSVQPSIAGVYKCRAGIVNGVTVTSRTDLCIEGKVKQNFNILYISLFV